LDVLAPTLKKGQIVFLDNVSTHKVDGVEEAIEARGARAVFLPAYSPGSQSHRTTLRKTQIILTQNEGAHR
jgi:transposase